MSETQYKTIERLKKENEALKAEISTLKVEKEADREYTNQLKEERDSAILALQEKEVYAVCYNTLPSQLIKFVNYTGLSVDRFDSIF